MSAEPQNDDPTHNLPSTESVRIRLAYVVREAAVLRRLLKLTEFRKQHLPDGNDQNATEEEAAQ